MGLNSIVYNCDCVSFMRGLPDKAYSLAIVDPPYGIGAENHAGSKKDGWTQWAKKEWDSSIPDECYFYELFRISKNQIIWGGNYFNLPPTKCVIVWDKGQRNFSLADGEIAWASFDKALRILTYPRALSNQECKIHPTQKPVALYRWLLRNYAKPGDTIFDSHMGSQSSRIACHMEGFDFTGCELDPEYFEQGNRRYETFTKKFGTPDPTTAIQGQQINLF